jgi:hypothetical protein
MMWPDVMAQASMKTAVGTGAKDVRRVYAEPLHAEI